MKDMKFKEILVNLREERSLTQKQLAKACQLSPQCISSLELGIRNPTGSTIVALAQVFDCSADYLLGLEDDFGARIENKKSAPQLSAEEQELLNDYRELSSSGKQLVKATIKTFLDNSKEKNVKSSKKRI